MLNMAKADLYRLIRSKGAYICLVVIAVMYATALFSDSFAIIGAGYDPSRYFDDSFQKDLRMVGCNSNYYFLLLFPVSILLLSDFGSSTLKNTLSSVTTKTKYYVFKFLAVQCVSIVYFLFGNTAYYVVRRLIYGSGKATAAADYFSVVLWQLPTYIATASIFVMLPSVYTVTIGTLLEIKKTRGFAEKYLVDYDFTNIYQYIAASRSTSFHMEVAVISFIIAAAAFIGGVYLFNRSEIMKQ